MANAFAEVPAAEQSWHLLEYWFDKNQGSSGRSHIFFDGAEVATGDVTGTSAYDPSDIYDGDGGENSQQVDMRVMNGACVDDFMWSMLLDRTTADHEGLHAAIEAYRLSGLPWEGGLPQNLVQLYVSAAEVPDGATLLDSYFDLFPRITADPALLGTTGGSSSHDGALHGSSGPFYTREASGLVRATNTRLFPNGYCFRSGFTHSHLVPEHTHGVVAAHIPPCFFLVPATCGEAGAGVLFLFQGSGVPAGWTAYGQHLTRYIRFHSDGGMAGAPTHQHLINLSTSPYSAGGSRRSWSWDRWPRSHAHSYNHGHAMANNPKYRTVRLIRRGDGQPIASLAELPSGAIALFNSADLPSGWTLLADPAEEGSLLKHDAVAGLYGGSSAHSHAPAAFHEPSGNMITLATRRTYRYSSGGGYVIGQHTHPVPPHGHDGAVDWMPPFVYLFAAMKD